MGHILNKLDIVRDPPLGDLAIEEAFELIGGEVCSGLIADHNEKRPLAPLGMNSANHCGLGHLVMTGGTVLDLDRGNPLTARLDDVFGSIGDRDIALGADSGHVARFKPARLCMGIRPLELVVARTDPRTSYLECTKGLAIPGQLLVVVVGDFDFNAPDRGADSPF